MTGIFFQSFDPPAANPVSGATVDLVERGGVVGKVVVTQ
jgi:hypothetical protein